MRFLQGLKSWAGTFLYVLWVIILQFWQLAGVVGIAIYNDRPFECLFLLIGFWVGRHFFDTTYHAPTMVICTLLTWGTFYFLTAGVPSFHVSFTITTLFGISLAFVLYIISEYLEGRKKDE